MILDLFIKPKERESKSGDSRLKSVAKALSWRIIGTFDTIVISYIITGEATVAISIGFIETFTKILLYFLHERAWNYFTVLKSKKV